jgi:predicted house-cleaning noncanonical NTP pyrophosphatase (MazG superfamily)
MRIEYNKLVRDRVPEIIRRQDKTCRTCTLDDQEYRQALRVKLLEEAEEAAHAPEGELGGELGDLLEVITALMEAYGLDETTVDASRRLKREKRGGFDSKTQLLWVEE